MARSQSRGLVDEPRRGYLRAGGQRSQLGTLFPGQRPVQREELVVLALADAAAPILPSGGGRRSIRRPGEAGPAAVGRGSGWPAGASHGRRSRRCRIRSGLFPHGYRDTKDRRLERHGQVVIDHGGEPGHLLVFVVTVHRGLGDQRVQFRLAQLAHDRKRGGKPPGADKGVPNRLTPTLSSCVNRVSSSTVPTGCRGRACPACPGRPASAAPAQVRDRAGRATVPRRPRRHPQRKHQCPRLACRPSDRPRPAVGRHAAGPPPVRPATCRLVLVAERYRIARRGRRPRGHQRARAARRLRALHRRPGTGHQLCAANVSERR